MTIDFHYHITSPPCRTVLLTAAALGLQLNKIQMTAEYFSSPEFLKLNPQHTIPTLVDDGFAIWESRTIIRYLVNKYGKNSSLYPEDAQKRALIDQRLDFDLGTLYALYYKTFYAPADQGAQNKLKDALRILDSFLKETKYAAGSELTLADHALVTTIGTGQIAGLDLRPYPNIERWFELVKSTATQFEEVTREATEAMKAFMAQKQQNKA